MKPRVFSLIAALAIGVVGCTTTPQFQTGPDAEVTHDGLTRLDRTVMDAVWARKDIDISGVNKIMFEGVGVEFRNVSGPYSGRGGTGTSRATTSSRDEFQLDAETRELFTAEISDAFLEELARSEVFDIVDEPGPDVLLISAGLLDVVSRVPPETIGRSRVFIENFGEATLVLEIRDSESHTVLVRAVDRRAAESGMGMREATRVTNRAEVRRLGRQWASLLRKGLESALADGMAP